MAGCHTDDFDWDVQDSPTMGLSQALKMVPGELLVVVGFESMGRTDPNQSVGQARDQYILERRRACRRSPVTSSSVDGSRPSRSSIEKTTRISEGTLQQRLLKPLQADELTHRIADGIATGKPERHARAHANGYEALPTRNTVSQLNEAGPDRACRLKDEGRRRDPARQERFA